MLNRLRRSGGLIVLGAFVAAVLWFGFEPVWFVTGVLFVAAVGYVYPLHLWIFRQRALRRPVAMERGRLVQRTESGDITATIDLSASFAARCLHQDSEWALYTAKQGTEMIRLAVPIEGDGAPVRALGLPWSPPLPSPYRYL